MPKENVHDKANTQGPYVKRVPKKKKQYFIGKNIRKRNTKDSKKNTFKVYNQEGH